MFTVHFYDLFHLLRQCKYIFPMHRVSEREKERKRERERERERSRLMYRGHESFKVINGNVIR